MSFIAKLWTTLLLLVPISLGIWYIDDGDSVISYVAIGEIFLWFGLTFGAVIAYIWAH